MCAAVGWVDAELLLVAIAAMLSPTTLTFSVLALVLGDRPFRTGALFYVGALGATLAVGVIAAFVIGDAAASDTPSSPKTWVAIFDLVAAAVIIVVVVRALRRPADPRRISDAVAQMSNVASSPAIAVVGAGAVLANPGGFIPLALKTISETDPSPRGYIIEWFLFAVVSLLPLLVALIMLLLAHDKAVAVLRRARAWLEGHARVLAAVILLVLAAVLVRNGIAGLVS